MTVHYWCVPPTDYMGQWWTKAFYFISFFFLLFLVGLLIERERGQITFRPIEIKCLTHDHSAIQPKMNWITHTMSLLLYIQTKTSALCAKCGCNLIASRELVSEKRKRTEEDSVTQWKRKKKLSHKKFMTFFLFIATALCMLRHLNRLHKLHVCFLHRVQSMCVSLFALGCMIVCACMNSHEISPASFQLHRLSLWIPLCAFGTLHQFHCSFQLFAHFSFTYEHFHSFAVYFFKILYTLWCWW